MGSIVQGFSSLIFEENVGWYYRLIFSLLPFALLSRGIDDLGQFSDSDDDVGMFYQIHCFLLYGQTICTFLKQAFCHLFAQLMPFFEQVCDGPIEILIRISSPSLMPTGGLC